MKYVHNSSVLIMRKVEKEDLQIIYRLFENENAYIGRYSVLISMHRKDGFTEDFFI